MSNGLITIVPETTVRGKHGLFIGGQPVDLTQSQINAISDELLADRREFKYRVVKKGQPLNRPSRKQQETPDDKQVKDSKTK